jgi:hypothetical protein
VHENWVYECTGCLHVWQEAYAVQHAADGHGGDAVVYLRDGQRCLSPWVDHLCPGCGCRDIKAVPAPWATHADALPEPHHHPELEMVFRLRRLHAY